MSIGMLFTHVVWLPAVLACARSGDKKKQKNDGIAIQLRSRSTAFSMPPPLFLPERGHASLVHSLCVLFPLCAFLRICILVAAVLLPALSVVCPCPLPLDMSAVGACSRILLGGGGEAETG